MVYSAYKLNKQGDNIQPWCTPFPIWNQSVVPCPVLTAASWLAYRRIKRQVRWVWYSQLLKNFLQFAVIHTVRGFGIVNNAEIYVFLELSCFFHDPADGNLISRFSAFFKTSLNIWKFTLHVLLKPGLEDFEHYFTRVWNECYCVVVWAVFGIAFFRFGMKTDLFMPVVTDKFSKFADILGATLSQHHLSGFEIAQLEFYHFH